MYLKLSRNLQFPPSFPKFPVIENKLKYCCFFSRLVATMLYYYKTGTKDSAGPILV